MAHIKLIPVDHLDEPKQLVQGVVYPVTDVVSVTLTHQGSIELQDEVELRVRVVEP